MGVHSFLRNLKELIHEVCALTIPIFPQHFEQQLSTTYTHNGYQGYISPLCVSKYNGKLAQ